MKCLKCGNRNEKNAKYCPNCGNKMPELYKGCKNCEALNEKSALFCKECGNDLDEFLEVYILEENKEEQNKVSKEIKNATILGIIAIVLNIVFASTLIVAHIIGIILSSIGLKRIAKYKKDEEAKSAKTLSVIGLVISIIFLVFKIALIVSLICLLISNPDVGEIPKYYF